MAEFTIKPALHFVGFRGDEYHSAVKVWGKPDFIQPAWDRWAQQDMHPVDMVIFARGTEANPVARFNYPPCEYGSALMVHNAAAHEPQ